MSKPVIAIVGAGATAVAVLRALVHFNVSNELQLFDPVQPGLGQAFNHDDDSMICNTSPDTMSLCAWKPNDFVHYLEDRGEKVTEGYFASRRIFRDYVVHTYSKTVDLIRRSGGHVQHQACKIREIQIGSNGKYIIRTTAGKIYTSDVVILATGTDNAFIPEPIRNLRGKHNFHSNPYELIFSAPSIEAEDVLIVGSKLSAIDAAVLLAGRNCTLTMVSPSGALPAVRTATPLTSARLIEPADLRSLDLSSPRLKERLFRLIGKRMAAAGHPRLSRQISRRDTMTSRFLEEVKIAEEGRHHWQRLIVELVDGVNEVLSPADDDLKDRVMVACREVIDRYLGSVSLQNASVIAQLLRDGSLSIMQGQLTNVTYDGRWQVHLAENAPLSFDRIVCATGYTATEIRASQNRIFLSGANATSENASIRDDLSIRVNGRDVQENIWVVGAASQAKVPLVNAMYSSVQHAYRVASRICEANIQ